MQNMTPTVILMLDFFMNPPEISTLQTARSALFHGSYGVTILNKKRNVSSPRKEAASYR